MITTKVKWKAVFVSLFFLCLYLVLLYIVIFIAVYITYTYPADDDADSQQELAERGYTLPEYVFMVECGGAESGESVVLEIKDEIIISVKNFENLKGKTLKLVWKDGSSKEIPIDSEELKLSDVFIGTACMLIQ